MKISTLEELFPPVGTTLAEITCLDESRRIYKSAGASAPACIERSNTMCTYWESRFELFWWGCEIAGFDPYEAEWVDGYTGEVLSYYDLAEEEE